MNSIFHRGSVVLAAALALAFTSFAATKAPKGENGLLLTLATEGGSEVSVTSYVSLYAPAGQAASPFVAAGKFTATWEGSVSVDLRGDYLFRAELNGGVKLELNGKEVFSGSSAGKSPVQAAKPLRLSKGANALKLAYTSPAQGDAFIRLTWSERGVLWEPVAVGALTHGDGGEALAKANQLRLGRELLAEHRCVKCHAGPAQGMAELQMDAPSFEGIGARRGSAWMAEWILDPKSQRSVARMPKLLHGPKAKEDAEAIATFLASLKESADKPLGGEGDAGAGQKLAEVLHCAGCHALPGARDGGPEKISLAHVNKKFSPGLLAAFLKNPAARYAWTHMPNFRLADGEAKNLAAFLGSLAERADTDAAPTDRAVVEHGKQLVQTTGCLNCHTAKLENHFKAKPLAELAAAKWQDGCLAASPKEDSKAPHYAFAEAERAALQAFGAGDRASLARHSSRELAERQTRVLHCTACHGQLEGFPGLDVIGGKLKPEWMSSFLAGRVAEKPRTWIEHRMPSFASRAELLAQGLAAQHGLPPKTPAEPAIDDAAAQVGRKLISTDGGFSCISCHAVGALGATQVFESAGVNFAYTGERLQRAYFERWVRNPLRVDPSSKMPVYFDEEGKSLLTDVLDGESGKQINALWQYFRMGSKMPPPPAP